ALKVYRFEDFEAALVRHLHVEQYEVRREPLDALDGTTAVAALADDFDLRVPRQQSTNAFARVQLVVNDQRPYLLHSLSATSVKRNRQAGRRPAPLCVLNHELLPDAVKLLHA